MIRAYFIFIIIFLSINCYSTVDNQNYKDGEKLSYVIHYGFLRAGKATLSIDKLRRNGESLMHLRMQAKTVGLANSLFKIKDTYESYVDASNYLPVKAVRSIREGRYRKHNVVLFDRKKNIATSKLTGKHSVPENIQDILSAFYLARYKYFNDTMNIGDVISLETFFSDELFPLQIKFMGYETIKSKVGYVNCYKFIPVTQKGRSFKNTDGMTLWVSADINKYPVRAQFDLLMGSVRCDLVDYNGYVKRK